MDKYDEQAEKIIPWDIEELSAILHNIYLNATLTVEATDKVLARWILDLRPAIAAALREASHCQDCCCAQSWAALGITKYTGRSIPEEITRLRAALIALANRRYDDGTLCFCDKWSENVDHRKWCRQANDAIRG